MFQPKLIYKCFYPLPKYTITNPNRKIYILVVFMIPYSFTKHKFYERKTMPYEGAHSPPKTFLTHKKRSIPFFYRTRKNAVSSHKWG